MQTGKVFLIFYIGLLGFTGLFGLVACDSKPPESAIISGQAYYRERMVVPNSSQLEVFLEDVSLADAPAKLLGSTLIPDAGQPPYSFEIRYQPNEIMPGHTFNLRARLTYRDELLFTTVQAYPVLSQVAGRNKLLLVRATAVKSTETPLPDPLLETRWRLLELRGKPVKQNKQTANIYFGPANQLSGSDGCNRLVGKYLVSGEALTFAELASTMMACMDNTEQAQVFNTSLSQVSHFKLDQNQLMLLNDAGETLARFKLHPAP